LSEQKQLNLIYNKLLIATLSELKVSYLSVLEEWQRTWIFFGATLTDEENTWPDTTFKQNIATILLVGKQVTVIPLTPWNIDQRPAMNLGAHWYDVGTVTAINFNDNEVTVHFPQTTNNLWTDKNGRVHEAIFENETLNFEFPLLKLAEKGDKRKELKKLAAKAKELEADRLDMAKKAEEKDQVIGPGSGLRSRIPKTEPFAKAILLPYPNLDPDDMHHSGEL